MNHQYERARRPHLQQQHSQRAQNRSCPPPCILRYSSGRQLWRIVSAPRLRACMACTSAKHAQARPAAFLGAPFVMYSHSLLFLSTRFLRVTLGSSRGGWHEDDPATWGSPACRRWGCSAAEIDLRVPRWMMLVDTSMRPYGRAGGGMMGFAVWTVENSHRLGCDSFVSEPVISSKT